MADNALRLALESWHILHAASFDARLAVHLARVDPLPHQVSAVYDAMLRRRPLRFLLADDPGAGKTIMAGLLITEMRARGVLRRCLVVAPGSLVDQWREELASRFDLTFALADRANLRDEGWLASNPLVIVRLDQCARDGEVVDRIAAASWDLAIFDEAHRLSASWNGARQDPTRRRRFAERVAAEVHHLLLMTATPHNGNEENFQGFLQLLDPDRFEGRFRLGVHAPRFDDLLCRRLKEDLRRYDGTLLFPPRRAATVRFALSPEEQQLYQDVTAYVRKEFDRAEARGGARGRTVGFALTVLQRRLASSPLAIYRSLRGRRERLGSRLKTLRVDDDADGDTNDDELESAFDLPDADDERAESVLVEGATAAGSIAELEDELRQLTMLEAAAQALVATRVDRKREAVAALLTSQEMRPSEGARRKLVVFTEHRDTLAYVVDFLGTLRGRPECVVSIDGTMDRTRRLEAQRAFADDPAVEFLVATDAAGEGINLQCASLVLNWDLPWSPARLEQRFGRVHRIGQRDPCQLWNLIAERTRETAVFDGLFRRLEEEHRALAGQVFDVLGAAFDERPLREFLLDAVRGKGDANEIGKVVDQRVGQAVTRQTRFSDRTGRLQDADASALAAQRDLMDRSAALSTGAARVGPWCLAAASALGARAHPREPGRWKINHVPAEWRAQDGSVPERLPLLAFTPEGGTPGDPLVALTAAHPWTRALAMATGRIGAEATLVDPHDAGETAWWLVGASQRLRDGGAQPLDAQAWMVAVWDDGRMERLEGPVHLDLRPLGEGERYPATGSGARAACLAALDRAVAAPWRHEVTAAHQHALEMAQREVQARLSAEVQHAAQRTAVARGRARRVPVVLANAERQEKALRGRLLDRAVRFDRQRQVFADALECGFVVRVVPAGALGAETRAARWHDHAVASVLRAERLRGRTLVDVRSRRVGWDLEGHDPVASRWRAWVVRAVEAGDTEVVLRRSEAVALLTAPESVGLVLVEVEDDGSTGIPVVLHGVVREMPRFDVCSVSVPIG